MRQSSRLREGVGSKKAQEIQRLSTFLRFRRIPDYCGMACGDWIPPCAYDCQRNVQDTCGMYDGLGQSETAILNSLWQGVAMPEATILMILG